MFNFDQRVKAVTVGVDSRRKGDLKREKARGNARYGMGKEVRTI